MPSEGKLEDNMAQESNNKDSSSIENNVLDIASPIGASEKKKDDGERTNPKTVMAAPAELSMASSEVRTIED